MEVTNNQNTLAFDCKHNILHFSHTFHLKRRTNVTRSVFYLLHNLSHHKRRSTNHRGSVLCIAGEGWGFASFQHWAGWARTKFLINASYMIMFRPCPCKGQWKGNVAWKRGKTDIWRGHGFAYAVRERQRHCIIKWSCNFFRLVLACCFLIFSLRFTKGDI
jgi:hypothetical protein